MLDEGGLKYCFKNIIFNKKKLFFFNPEHYDNFSTANILLK